MFEMQALLKAPNLYFKSPEEFKGYVRVLLYGKLWDNLCGPNQEVTFLFNKLNDLHTYQELSRFINAVLAHKQEPKNEDFMLV